MHGTTDSENGFNPDCEDGDSGAFSENGFNPEGEDGRKFGSLLAGSENGFKSNSGAGSLSTSGRMLSVLEETVGRNLKQVQVNTCPEGQSQFIEQQALHQTHTIIFYIA